MVLVVLHCLVGPHPLVALLLLGVLWDQQDRVDLFHPLLQLLLLVRVVHGSQPRLRVLSDQDYQAYQGVQFHQEVLAHLAFREFLGYLLCLSLPWVQDGLQILFLQLHLYHPQGLVVQLAHVDLLNQWDRVDLVHLECLSHLEAQLDQLDPVCLLDPVDLVGLVHLEI